MRQSAVSTEPRSAPASRAEHPPRGAESCLHPSSTREASRDERMTPKRVFPGMLAVLEDCRRFGLCGLFTKPPLEFGPGGWFDNPLLDASLNCGRRWRHGSPFTTRNSYRSDPHVAGGAQRYFSRRALVVRHKRVCARDEGRRSSSGMSAQKLCQPSIAYSSSWRSSRSGLRNTRITGPAPRFRLREGRADEALARPSTSYVGGRSVRRDPRTR